MNERTLVNFVAEGTHSDGRYSVEVTQAGTNGCMRFKVVHNYSGSSCPSEFRLPPTVALRLARMLVACLESAAGEGLG